MICVIRRFLFLCTFALIGFLLSTTVFADCFMVKNVKADVVVVKEGACDLEACVGCPIEQVEAISQSLKTAPKLSLATLETQTQTKFMEKLVDKRGKVWNLYVKASPAEVGSTEVSKNTLVGWVSNQAGCRKFSFTYSAQTGNVKRLAKKKLTEFLGKCDCCDTNKKTA